MLPATPTSATVSVSSTPRGRAQTSREFESSDTSSIDSSSGGSGGNGGGGSGSGRNHLGQALADAGVLVEANMDDDTFLFLLRESRVLDVAPGGHGYLQWNLGHVIELTKPAAILDRKRLDGPFAKIFMKRLIGFLKPSSGLFGAVAIDSELADMYVGGGGGGFVAACNGYYRGG
jgi:hypothetical protein